MDRAAISGPGPSRGPEPRLPAGLRQAHGDQGWRCILDVTFKATYKPLHMPCIVIANDHGDFRLVFNPRTTASIAAAVTTMCRWSRKAGHLRCDLGFPWLRFLDTVAAAPVDRVLRIRSVSDISMCRKEGPRKRAFSFLWHLWPRINPRVRGPGTAYRRAPSVPAGQGVNVP